MPRSLFSVHPRILMDLPRPPPSPPSHSAVSVEFLPIFVLRRSTLIFPKIPRGSRRFFFLISPPYLYCVFTRLSTIFFSLFLPPPPVLTSSISYFLPPSAIVLLPPAWSLLLPPPCPVSPRIYSSLVASLCPFASSLASSFFPRQPGDLRRFPRATSPPSTPPSRIPTRDNPYKLEH